MICTFKCVSEPTKSNCLRVGKDTAFQEKKANFLETKRVGEKITSTWLSAGSERSNQGLQKKNCYLNIVPRIITVYTPETFVIHTKQK